MNSTNNNSTNWDNVCRCAEAGFEWCLSKAAQNRLVGRLEMALGWLSVAAWSASRVGFFGKVASLELEHELTLCADQMDFGSSSNPTGERKRWMHVLDEAYAVGGHTALCWRWIKERAATEQHSVLLTGQRDRVPQKLRDAVEFSGGTVHLLDPGLGLVERARQLRSLACQHCDVVVLHTHPASVIPAVAFGRAGGPAVIVVNHADHLFQATGAVADVVFDIRESGQEWTRTGRGISNTAILTIPLIEESTSGDFAVSEAEVRAARKQLGLPNDSVILLTVGSGFKYAPVQNLSFQSAVEPVLLANPSTFLVAVGPEDDGEWQRLRKTTSGRVLAMGTQENLIPFHRSADIYIEGFPIGSLTAMLEGGLAGLPCVRAPKLVPAPFCSDGIAFENNVQPRDTQEYARDISKLIRDPAERRRLGQLMKTSVRQHHCLSGWVKYLENGLSKVPATHSIHSGRKIDHVSLEQRNYWLARLHTGVDHPGAESIGSAILCEATARGLLVEDADYDQLGSILQRGMDGVPARTETGSLVSGGLSGNGAPALSTSRRLKERTRAQLRNRRMLGLWEKSKKKVFERLGVVRVMKKIGRTVVGDLRR